MADDGGTDIICRGDGFSCLVLYSPLYYLLPFFFFFLLRPQVRETKQDFLIEDESERGAREPDG